MLFQFFLCVYITVCNVFNTRTNSWIKSNLTVVSYFINVSVNIIVNMGHNVFNTRTNSWIKRHVHHSL